MPFDSIQQTESQSPVIHIDVTRFLRSGREGTLIALKGLAFLGVVVALFVGGFYIAAHRYELGASTILLGLCFGFVARSVVNGMNRIFLRPDFIHDARVRILNPKTEAQARAAAMARFDYDRIEAEKRLNRADLATIFGWSVSLFTGKLWGIEFAKGRRKKLCALAEQHASLSASELRQRDTRSPVVYLRAFADETRIRESALETVIVDTGFLVGPVVAIGQPGERLPPVGAARDYVPDDSWKEWVTGWMDQAQAVILVLGHTMGVAWEAVTLLDKGLLSRAVLILPPDSGADRDALLESFLRHTQSETLAASLASLDHSRTAAILLDENRRISIDVGNIATATVESVATRYKCALQFALAEVVARRSRAAEENAQPDEPSFLAAPPEMARRKWGISDYADELLPTVGKSFGAMFSAVLVIGCISCGLYFQARLHGWQGIWDDKQHQQQAAIERERKEEDIRRATANLPADMNPNERRRRAELSLEQEQINKAHDLAKRLNDPTGVKMSDEARKRDADLAADVEKMEKLLIQRREKHSRELDEQNSRSPTPEASQMRTPASIPP